jgi:hypothetical protein
MWKLKPTNGGDGHEECGPCKEKWSNSHDGIRLFRIIDSPILIDSFSSVTKSFAAPH